MEQPISHVSLRFSVELHRVRTRIKLMPLPDGRVVEVPDVDPDPPRRWWLWLVGGLVLVLGGAAVGLALWHSREKVIDPGPAPEGMVWIPANQFWMGSSETKFTDSRPEHEVQLDGFWIDAKEVTNAEFERFTRETGFKTLAELKPESGTNITEKGEEIEVGSLVFLKPAGPTTPDNPLLWWKFVPGADWRHPEGPNSTIVGRENHPVVNVTWWDAIAYCEWAGKRLPTEAEWECAARGGLSREPYCWGERLKPGGKWLANIWQGRFPLYNTAEDGFAGTSPVASYPPNGYGVYDMSGNVWEWCQDWYRPDYYETSPKRNPQGPSDSYEPAEPLAPRKVQRGGSYLSNDTNDRRFMPGARGRSDPLTSSCHVGFRCAKSP
jgi:formylglycine-generating enzyme required for sulfatase activity